MESFEKLLNEGCNDNPDMFPCKWERKYWGDKVEQYNEYEDAVSLANGYMDGERLYASYKSDLGKRDSRRRRTARYKKRLRALARLPFYPSGASIEESGAGKEYARRYYRGLRSKYIKKECNRQFRRSSKLNMLVMSARGGYRRVTEFWWEYD